MPRGQLFDVRGSSAAASLHQVKIKKVKSSAYISGPTRGAVGQKGELRLCESRLRQLNVAAAEMTTADPVRHLFG